jgi:hypothetical protein
MIHRTLFRISCFVAVLAIAASFCGGASAQRPLIVSVSDRTDAEPDLLPSVVEQAAERDVAEQESSFPFESPPLSLGGAAGVPYSSAASLPMPPRSRTYCTDSCPLCRPSGPLRRRWREQWKPLMQETHWGYCEYFEPVPYGSQVHEAIVRQLAKAYRERLVLYQVDFRAADDPHPEQLTDRGRRELARILQDMQIVPGLILIEYSRTDPGLDRRRQTYVQQLLETLGSGVPAEAVIVGPAPGGLSGLEALSVFGNFLQGTAGGAAAGGRMPAGSGRPGAAAGVGAALGTGGGAR